MPKIAANAVAAQKITSADMRLALKRHFPHPEFGIVFEVAQSTGHAAHRHIDAVAMDTWPSRGLTLHAIEIKVDRGDWRREKRQPEKAEQLARFCDVFWIAAPEGVVPTDELPMAWGLLELSEIGKPLKVKRGPSRTGAQDVDRNFLAAIMRAAGRGLVKDDVDARLEAQRKRLDDEFETKLAEGIERKREIATSAAKQWDKLMAALGIEAPTFHGWYDHDTDRIVAVFKAIQASGITNTYRGLADLQASLAELKTGVDAAMSMLHVAPKDDLAALRHIARSGKRKGSLV